MKKHITAFYLETLALIVAFLGILLVLTQVFGLARVQSERAGQLTAAVGLAERAAEAVASADSLEDAQTLLDENDNTEIRENTLELREGDLLARVTWEPDGNLVKSHIAVYWNDRELYSIDTATRGEAAT